MNSHNNCKNIFSIPNELIFNLPDYNEREEFKNPRSVIHILPVFHYRDILPTSP